MIKLTPLLVFIFNTACDHTHAAQLDAGSSLSDGMTPTHIAPPWAPPVAHADGGAVGRDGSTVTPPPGPARWTLTGDVVQITPCAGGGKASQVHVALSAGCGDWTKVLYSQVVSLAGAKPRYAFQVPDGTYHLIAFADCGGGGAANVTPVPGDVQFVTMSAGVKPCRTYTLKGQGLLDVPLKLDAVVK